MSSAVAVMMTSINSNHSNSVVLDQEEQPISRTYQYRKVKRRDYFPIGTRQIWINLLVLSFRFNQVMKPMLERKRRARINRCLDELKELMSSALASEGENLTKLEKADVLELTVRHLHKLRERQALNLPSAGNVPSVQQQDKFRAGFTHCAAEVSRYLAASTGLDVQVGQRLLSHLGRCVHQLESSPQPYTPPSSPTHATFAPIRPIVVASTSLSPALSESDLSVRSDLYSPSSESKSVWRPW